MKIQLDFNNIKVKEHKKDFTVKILMLKGEKGDTGDLDQSKIVDNLTSTDNTKVLSAKQGKVLKDLVDKKPYYFDTVSDMKAGNLSAGDMAITKGYYSANDGGGAEYNIVASTSNYSETLNNNLKAELIIKSSVTPEMFGAYGDGTHDDSTALQNAILTGIEVRLFNKTYIVNYCVTKTAPNIILIGDNTIIKTDRTTTDSYGHDYYGIITDDDYQATSYFDGGKVIIKNINFDGNADNFTSWLYKGFGFINVYNRKNVVIENCNFENITNDAINVQGIQNNAIVKNCNFKNVGLNEPTGNARRNAISCSTSYYDRATSTTKYSDGKTGLFVTECNFNNIADECVAPRNITKVVFNNNNCSNIGQRVIEAGNNYNNSEYMVDIENCYLYNIAESLYSNGGDGGKNNPYKGIIKINNVKGENMAWDGKPALFSRSHSTSLVHCYNTDATKEPDVYISNSYFKSVTLEEDLTPDSTRNFIVANNVYIDNSTFIYPYVEFNYLIVPYGKLTINGSYININKLLNDRYILAENSNIIIINDTNFISSDTIYALIRIGKSNTTININNMTTSSYYHIVNINNENYLTGFNIKLNNCILGNSTARTIHCPDNATTTANSVICTNNVFGSIQYGSVFNGNATFKLITNNSNYNV